MAPIWSIALVICSIYEKKVRMHAKISESFEDAGYLFWGELLGDGESSIAGQVFFL